MITLQALLQFLKSTFASFDGKDPSYNGLQVDGKVEVKKIGFAVSASLEVIEKAKQLSCDALVVHHGIFWEKEQPLIIGPRYKKLSILLSSGISLIAYHLPLDAHPYCGNNWKAAEDLGLFNLKPFGKWDKQYIGVKGEIKQLPLESFVNSLENYYKHPAAIASCGNVPVSKVAIVSGGAHKMIVEASEEGVNCFVTGSFDEPIWDLAKELGVHFVALGHHATERIGSKALMDEVKKAFKIDTVFIDVENPF